MRLVDGLSLRLAMPLALGLATLAACKSGDGGSDSASTDSATDTGTATGDVNETSTGTGDGDGDDQVDDDDDGNAIGLTGSVALQVTPISSSGDFASLEADRVDGLPPGTLALPDGGALRHSPRVFSLLDGTPPIFNPEWIASGAPTGLKLTIKKIVLVPKAEDGQDAKPGEVVFATKEGVQISLDSGAVDLSAMLAAVGAATGQEVKFEVPVGTYDEVQVTYARAAEVRGCVSAAFKDVPATTRTFCTKTDKSVFDSATSVDADFETSDPTVEGDWMKLDLDRSWVGTHTATEDFPMSYPLDKPLVVADGATVTLSIVVDLNRILRYHRSGADIAPNPGFPEASAYFFTTLFSESLYVFGGQPGRIYGYEGVVEACKTETWDVGTKSCTSQAHTIAFWMTIVTDVEGKALLFSTMPDDDNVLTIVKGNSFGEPAFLSAGTAGGVDVKFSLGDDIGGVFKNFPTTLDADTVGETVDGVELESKHVSGDTYHGMPFITRRL